MSPRAGLSSQRVVAAAGELADRDGWDGLTLTAVAGELGVRPPSLYSHIDGIDGLRAELRLEGIRQLHDRLATSSIGKARGEAITAMANAMRRYAAERPAMYAATVQASHEAGASRQAGDDTVAVVLAILEGYGLVGEEAIHAARYLRSAVHGFIALESAGGFGLPYEVDKSFDRLVRQLTLSLERWAD